MEIRALVYFYDLLDHKVEYLEKTRHLYIKSGSPFDALLRHRFVQKIIIQLSSHRFRRTVLFYLNFRNSHHVQGPEKIFALDFLKYCLQINPAIPFKLFPRRDYSEIQKFVKNKFIYSIFEEQNSFVWNKDNKRRDSVEADSKKTSFKFIKGYSMFQGFRTEGSYIQIDLMKNKYGIIYVRDKKRIRRTTAIDAGAYDGASTWAINNALEPKQIIAVEPNYKNFRLLRNNLALNRLDRVIPIRRALGAKSGLTKIEDAGMDSRVSLKGAPVQEDTIDSICRNLKIAKVGLIKLDIEGAEYEALVGAKNTIKKDKPVLIISLYHKGRDLFEIPYYLKELVPSYRFRFISLDPNSLTLERVLIAEV